MKLFTIFFYIIAALYAFLYTALLGSNAFGIFGGMIILVYPILLIFSPLIALTGFLYAYNAKDKKLLAWYTALVVIPVSIICCTWVLNTYN